MIINKKRKTNSSVEDYKTDNHINVAKREPIFLS